MKPCCSDWTDWSLTRSFRSRSQVVQEAVSEKISRMDKSALARECAKLDRKSEQAMADEGLAAYCRPA